MNKSIIEEISAGGVVYRTVGKLGESDNQRVGVSDKFEFLIGKHSGYHKWVLPKGLVEKGESYPETAMREVAEEVGVVASVVEIEPIKTIEYWYYADLETKMGKDAKGEDSERRVKNYQEQGGTKTRIHKKVIFYLMNYESDLGGAGWEMEERKWVTYEEGLALLAFESEKEVFERAGKEVIKF